jgi:hypothetical protein
MDELLQRSRDCRAQLWTHIRNNRARHDLQIMLNAAERELTELSKEAVNCRRHQRVTRQYEEIYRRVDQAFDNFEKHLLIARLKY